MVLAAKLCPFVLDYVLDSLSVEHFELLCVLEELHQRDALVKNFWRTILILFYEHSRLKHQVNLVFYFLNFRWVKVEMLVRVLENVFKTTELIFMEHLGVGISKMKQTPIIRLDNSFFIIMSLGPFIKFKSNIEHLRMH